MKFLSLLVSLAGLLLILAPVSSRAEDAEHAVVRFMKAASQAADAATAAKDPALKHEFTMQYFAYFLVGCDEAEETASGSDPQVMTDCAEERARFKKFSDLDQMTIENRISALRLSTMQ
jgi:hypothetical protein